MATQREEVSSMFLNQYKGEQHFTHVWASGTKKEIVIGRYLHWSPLPLQHPLSIKKKKSHHTLAETVINGIVFVSKDKNKP